MTTTDTMRDGEARPQGIANTYAPELQVARENLGTEDPSPLPSRNIYLITINTMDHGYIVEIGCKKFAIETREKLLHHLGAYLAAPYMIEREYINGKYVL